jgi:molybdopterin-guanine dinucleotide biosynthesis adapter protein
MRSGSRPCVISVVGPQNAGKTRLVSQMVAMWTGWGLRVAAVKHDGHADAQADDDWEKSGSDTLHYAKAGAAITLVAGGGSSLLRVVRDRHADDVDALCQRLQEVATREGEPVDVVVVEGFKRSELPKVVPLRRSTDVDWLRSEHLSNLFAVVCPEAALSLADGEWPVYHESDVARLCRDIWDGR